MEKDEQLCALIARGSRLAFSHEGKDIEGVVTYVGQGAGFIAITVEAYGETYELVVENGHANVIALGARLAA